LNFPVVAVVPVPMFVMVMEPIVVVEEPSKLTLFVP
jgi:hypothetical protein